MAAASSASGASAAPGPDDGPLHLSNSVFAGCLPVRADFDLDEPDALISRERRPIRRYCLFGTSVERSARGGHIRLAAHDLERTSDSDGFGPADEGVDAGREVNAWFAREINPRWLQRVQVDPRSRFLKHPRAWATSAVTRRPPRSANNL
jgi:hypothetical protein